jgi:hypothetical protein
LCPNLINRKLTENYDLVVVVAIVVVVVVTVVVACETLFSGK